MDYNPEQSMQNAIFQEISINIHLNDLPLDSSQCNLIPRSLCGTDFT